MPEQFIASLSVKKMNMNSGVAQKKMKTSATEQTGSRLPINIKKEIKLEVQCDKNDPHIERSALKSCDSLLPFSNKLNKNPTLKIEINKIVGNKNLVNHDIAGNRGKTLEKVLIEGNSPSKNVTFTFDPDSGKITVNKAQAMEYSTSNSNSYLFNEKSSLNNSRKLTMKPGTKKLSQNLSSMGMKSPNINVRKKFDHTMLKSNQAKKHQTTQIKMLPQQQASPQEFKFPLSPANNLSLPSDRKVYTNVGMVFNPINSTNYLVSKNVAVPLLNGYHNWEKILPHSGLMFVTSTVCTNNKVFK